MVAAYVLPYHTFSINFVSPWFYQQDYAKLQVTQLEYQAPMLLMHEVTHLMQNKKMFSYVQGISRYTYVLSPDKTFEGYGQEQQAIMIEDYISRFLCPSPLPSFETWHMKNDVDCAERDALLAETVENQFPQARISREGVAAGKLKLVI